MNSILVTPVDLALYQDVKLHLAEYTQRITGLHNEVSAKQSLEMVLAQKLHLFWDDLPAFLWDREAILHLTVSTLVKKIMPGIGNIFCKYRFERGDIVLPFFGRVCNADFTYAPVGEYWVGFQFLRENTKLSLHITDRWLQSDESLYYTSVVRALLKDYIKPNAHEKIYDGLKG